MPATRESIFAAAFARIASATPFAFTSRVFQSWDDTPPAECPAMFFYKGPEDRTVQQGMPPLLKLTGVCVVYARNDADPEAAPSTQLNAILDAIESALAYQPTEGQVVGAPFVANPYAGYGTTLGGLVAYCRIAGTIEVAEGLIGGGAAMVVPIEMLATTTT